MSYSANLDLSSGQTTHPPLLVIYHHITSHLQMVRLTYQPIYPLAHQEISSIHCNVFSISHFIASHRISSQPSFPLPPNSPSSQCPNAPPRCTSPCRPLLPTTQHTHALKTTYHPLHRSNAQNNSGKRRAVKKKKPCLSKHMNMNDHTTRQHRSITPKKQKGKQTTLSRTKPPAPFHPIFLSVVPLRYSRSCLFAHRSFYHQKRRRPG